MYPGNPINNMYPYGSVAAMVVLRSEARLAQRSEIDPIKDGLRFVARKFGILLIKVGSRLEHIGYPHVSSTQS